MSLILSLENLCISVILVFHPSILDNNHNRYEYIFRPSLSFSHL